MSKTDILIIIVIIGIVVFLFSGVFVRRSDIQELIDEKLIDQFSIVSFYLDGDDEYTRQEAQDAFSTIRHELDKLY
ncbi:MAG: hypothetical protein J6Y48_08295 [Clostridia bacterium]|nr:hypothetical protein [Clostridia bacterium]